MSGHHTGGPLGVASRHMNGASHGGVRSSSMNIAPTVLPHNIVSAAAFARQAQAQAHAQAQAQAQHAAAAAASSATTTLSSSPPSSSSLLPPGPSTSPPPLSPVSPSSSSSGSVNGSPRPNARHVGGAAGSMNGGMPVGPAVPGSPNGKRSKNRNNNKGGMRNMNGHGNDGLSWLNHVPPGVLGMNPLAHMDPTFAAAFSAGMIQTPYGPYYNPAAAAAAAAHMYYPHMAANHMHAAQAAAAAAAVAHMTPSPPQRARPLVHMQPQQLQQQPASSDPQSLDNIRRQM